MALISVDSLTKTINEKTLFQNVSFSVEPNDRIGLIGINGSGKSTLLKIIAGQEPMDAGTILKRKDCTIQYLSQNPVFHKETIWQEMKSHDPKQKIPDYQIRSVLTKLGFTEFDQAIAPMSGGQKKRLALAVALMQPCDLLILDEPTNHLDNEMVEWLQTTLSSMKSALLMVTHDRYFLDELCTELLEIDRGDFYVHHGNYETYLQNKQERLELEARLVQKHKNLYRKELAWVRAGVQARTTKSQARLDRFEQLRTTRFKSQERALELMAISKRLGKKTIICDALGMSYGKHEVFHSFSYTLLKHDRVGLIGTNGCGKSTLLNLIAGLFKPTSGSIEYGQTVSIGYFQQGDERIDVSMRMIDYIKEAAHVIHIGKQEITAGQMLERFLFDKSMHYTPIDRLSGGERRRLYLCRVLMQMPNVLLLDEPTNDLDLLTLEVLEDYLDEFGGIVITASHDRYFLDRICDKVFVFQDDHTWKEYPGGYSDYRRKVSQQKKTPVQKKDTRTKRIQTLSYYEKKELEKLPQIMEQLEKQLEQINEQIGQTSAYEQMIELSKRRDALDKRLEEATMRWMELEEKKEGQQNVS